MKLALGKLPARHDSRDLQFAHYRTIIDPPKLSWPCRKPKPTPGPPVPTGGDTDNLSRVVNWGMLGNDRVGDCVFAGADHETMLWLAIAGTPASFDARDALADYSSVTGYDPNKPDTDQGTDVHVALNWRRSTGVIDAGAKRHKIAAYMALEPKNLTQLQQSVVWFDATGIGFEFPSSARDQFAAGKPWTVVPGASIEGGHYVPIIGWDAVWLYCVTWGRIQKLSPQFFQTFTDEAYAILSPEFLKGGRSPEGFDLGQLETDLASL